MKKTIGIPFMFLATLVILAHAFIPHQHHDRIVISISDIFFIDKIFNHHHDHPHSHEYGHCNIPVNQDHKDAYSDDCLLDDLYRHLKQTNKYQLADVEENKSQKNGRVPFIVVAPVLKIEITDYGELPYRQNPFAIAKFISHFGYSLSFRGPPAC